MFLILRKSYVGIFFKMLWSLRMWCFLPQGIQLQQCFCRSQWSYLELRTPWELPTSHQRGQNVKNFAKLCGKRICCIVWLLYGGCGSCRCGKMLKSFLEAASADWKARQQSSNNLIQKIWGWTRLHCAIQKLSKLYLLVRTLWFLSYDTGNYDVVVASQTYSEYSVWLHH